MAAELFFLAGSAVGSVLGTLLYRWHRDRTADRLRRLIEQHDFDGAQRVLLAEREGC